MIGLNITDLEADWPEEMTHYRVWDIGAAWKDIHVAPRTYDWTRLDRIIEKADGRHVLYVIGATPKWLAMNPDSKHAASWLGPGSNSLPHDIDHFNEFCWQLASRYAGRIHAYEVWNEPQLADFLYPYTDASCNRLATMTARAFRTIKAVDPDALVLSGSLLPRASSGGMKRAMRYLNALAAKGWPVDAFAVHIYPECDQGPRRWANMLQDVVSTLKGLRAPTSKVWITETAYGLLCDPVPDVEARENVRGTYAVKPDRFIYWYALNRPDLKGMQVSTGPISAAWQTIMEEHDAD